MDSSDNLAEEMEWREELSLKATMNTVEVSLDEDRVGRYFRLVAMPVPIGQTEMPENGGDKP